ncbi:hypothetical protein K431DRAFT_232509 [Polychaeton citri CBS 116435]|uniref:Fatty acid hydroxylase domain-containing protein n=1 Tax=Polychaeton citri CBS 116435 TaxID=1314669 RepID=A0A9P4Q3K3_9PEZI|nr:hypothetical protein K431DRAFT_232509 [Polychaeton citri CBS 116435]
MASALATLRDNALYSYGYLQGRYYGFPGSFAEVYSLTVSKVSGFASLPLPLLSFLALPVFGGTSTSINLVLFYLTWSALVLSQGQFSIEIWGSLAIRLLFYLLPALGLLAFDCAAPTAARALKAERSRALPQNLGRDRLLRVAGVASFNVLLGVLVQALLELLATSVLHTRSILKVTTTVPLPWSIGKDILKGLLFRGVVHYGLHRYVLHTYNSKLKTWHLGWQHSIKLPFSLMATYDHPVDYLLVNWFPVFLPAFLFRFHVLTWHILLALVSLEDLFLYSGYAVLPSSIILAGMARRTDSHFLTADEPDEVGNFGHWGVLDLVCGTGCRGASDAMDDMQDEADKHKLQEKLQGAVQGAKGGIEAAEDSDEASSKPAGKRRSKRNMARKEQIEN